MGPPRRKTAQDYGQFGSECRQLDIDALENLIRRGRLDPTELLHAKEALAIKRQQRAAAKEAEAKAQAEATNAQNSRNADNTERSANAAEASAASARRANWISGLSLGCSIFAILISVAALLVAATDAKIIAWPFSWP